MFFGTYSYKRKNGNTPNIYLPNEQVNKRGIFIHGILVSQRNERRSDAC